LQDTSILPSHQQQCIQPVYSEIPEESAWWVLFRPPWCCGASQAIEGHQT
jgi:hypothetical protein